MERLISIDFFILGTFTQKLHHTRLLHHCFSDLNFGAYRSQDLQFTALHNSTLVFNMWTETHRHSRSFEIGILWGWIKYSNIALYGNQPEVTVFETGDFFSLTCTRYWSFWSQEHFLQNVSNFLMTLWTAKLVKYAVKQTFSAHKIWAPASACLHAL